MENEITYADIRLPPSSKQLASSGEKKDIFASSDLQKCLTNNDFMIKMNLSCNNISCEKSVISNKVEFHVCPKEWMVKASRCYFISNSSLSWNESQKSCMDMDSDLLIINSHYEQKFITNNSAHNKYFWMGLIVTGTDTKFRWVDESKLNDNIKFWRESQPDNKSSQGSEHCATVGGNDEKNWNDAFCGTNNRYVCEKEAQIFLEPGL
ncbi:C-type lectin domain family 4 member C isoform X2 [Bombina bombina]|uniref:C-type lectin domain family 4 member C isoform X2 n=1 Tax=Bombina bombina TaxID=8345 RepID=UPI00235AA7BD|nr:C-type lectin domain family 4 member C isoform X2 [Bombina bombina]